MPMCSSMVINAIEIGMLFKIIPTTSESEKFKMSLSPLSEIFTKKTSRPLSSTGKKSNMQLSHQDILIWGLFIDLEFGNNLIFERSKLICLNHFPKIY